MAGNLWMVQALLKKGIDYVSRDKVLGNTVAWVIKMKDKELGDEQIRDDFKKIYGILRSIYASKQDVMSQSTPNLPSQVSPKSPEVMRTSSSASSLFSVKKAPTLSSCRSPEIPEPEDDSSDERGFPYS